MTGSDSTEAQSSEFITYTVVGDIVQPNEGSPLECRCDPLMH